MFKAHCPRHGSDVLLFADNVESVRNRPNGIELRWTCTCGYRGRSVSRGPKRNSPVR